VAFGDDEGPGESLGVGVGEGFVVTAKLTGFNIGKLSWLLTSIIYGSLHVIPVAVKASG
jgi:hypothetical protein